MNGQNRLIAGDALANLPILQPDETLYSWAGAVHLSNPTPDVRETSRRLYGAPFAALLHDFPSHLGALAENVGDKFGSSSTLALGHTLLGYFLSVRPHEFTTRILQATMDGGVGSLKFQLGIAASRVGGHHPLKGCPICFSRQIEEGGRAFWMVSHQLPSVFCCVEHGELLQVAWDATTPVHRRGWILPRGGLEKEWRAYTPVNAIQFQRLERLARFSMRWALQSPSAFDAKRLALVYRAALRNHDLMTQAGSLRLAEIVRLIRQHYSGLEGLSELRSIQCNEPSWSTLVGAASRESPRPCHPLKHLLLISALFASWDEFIATYDAEPSDPAEVSAEDAVLPPEKVNQQMERFTELVERHGLSISAAGRKVGVTATTAVRWAKVRGLEYRTRAKTYSVGRLDEARGMLRQGTPKAQVVERLGFSAGAVNRLISSEPEVAAAWRAARHELARRDNRRRFSKALAQMPDRPLKEIRAMPGCGYAWLYRHDRQWLLEHLPFFGLSAQPAST